MSAGQVDSDRRKQIQDDCTSEAWASGAKSALTALAIAGATVGAANTFFAGFRRSLGVSGKAALVVSAVTACKGELLNGLRHNRASRKWLMCL